MRKYGFHADPLTKSEFLELIRHAEKQLDIKLGPQESVEHVQRTEKFSRSFIRINGIETRGSDLFALVQRTDGTSGTFGYKIWKDSKRYLYLRLSRASELVDIFLEK